MHTSLPHLILTFVLASTFQGFVFASPNGQLKTNSPTAKIKNDLADPGIYAAGNSSIFNETRFEISYLSGVIQKTKETTTAAHFDFEKLWRPDPDLAIATNFGLTIGNILTAEAFKRTSFTIDGYLIDKKLFYDLGGSLFIDPNDKLANFIDYQRYFATARILAESWGSVGANLTLRYGYLGFQYSVGLRCGF